MYCLVRCLGFIVGRLKYNQGKAMTTIFISSKESSLVNVILSNLSLVLSVLLYVEEIVKSSRVMYQPTNNLKI